MSGSECMKTLNIITDYVKPSEICCQIVRASDMTCVCHALEPNEEVLQKASAVKLVRLSRVYDFLFRYGGSICQGERRQRKSHERVELLCSARFLCHVITQHKNDK